MTDPHVPPPAPRRYKSKLEERYAREILEPLRLRGQIRAWWYEPASWVLGDDVRYTPDFLVVMDDGTIEIHETKGFMREAARVRVRVFARTYPFPVYVITLQQGTYRRERLPA